jgi:hypothetical protein
VSNWIAECSRFFDDSKLRAKEWTKSAWDEDWIKNPSDSIRTVWIVRESSLKRSKGIGGLDSDFWSVFGSRRFSQRFEILSTFADEAHKAWRNSSSERSQVYRHVARISCFNVLMTGTM